MQKEAERMGKGCRKDRKGYRKDTERIQKDGERMGKGWGRMGKDGEGWGRDAERVGNISQLTPIAGTFQEESHPQSPHASRALSNPIRAAPRLHTPAEAPARVLAYGNCARLRG